MSVIWNDRVPRFHAVWFNSALWSKALCMCNHSIFLMSEMPSELCCILLSSSEWQMHIAVCFLSVWGEADSPSSVLKCWNCFFFLFYFILLYVSLFFYSISPDRHKHHKGMSQHKKRREKNCWHMTLVFIAMTKRCRKWKLQNSGNIRLDLKTEKILSLGKKNNPKTIKQKNVFTELWQQTEIRPILCYTQWGSEGLLDLKMKQWSLQQ